MSCQDITRTPERREEYVQLAILLVWSTYGRSGCHILQDVGDACSEIPGLGPRF